MPGSVELNAKQLDLIRIEPVRSLAFAQRQDAMGTISFDQDRTSQVSTPYQGRIVAIFAQLGDHVRRGQPLFTLESPDLIQAESALIAAAGVRDLTDRALKRTRDLAADRGASQAALDQAVSDQMTAEGAYAAARQAVRVFGKSEAEIDAIIYSRKVDPALVIRSPTDGVISARAAAPGMLVQPGSNPAPFSVSDTSRLWMLAEAPEAEAQDFRIGEPVSVKVDAVPGVTFPGKIETIAANVDPNLHTVELRSEIRDPSGRLKPGMLASFRITTGPPVPGLALPQDGVVREGDGTLTAWVTRDRRHFFQRRVTVGLTVDGYDQILTGLEPGELAVTKGAVFLDNMLNATPDDD
ncbi:MAG: efflux RND transporter periplasmic adaptor subunit [Alphaproteobacteria bacterium]|nr:efflux RND transporter periplasmic adaptor subunit [Alphaproteobacteria bacterium]